MQSFDDQANPPPHVHTVLNAPKEPPPAKVLRVLVACEFSSIVRDAFLEKGHDAWSCDLLPAEHDNVAFSHISGRKNHSFSALETTWRRAQS
jgi:hypothetical protein